MTLDRQPSPSRSPAARAPVRSRAGQRARTALLLLSLICSGLAAAQEPTEADPDPRLPPTTEATPEPTPEPTPGPTPDPGAGPATESGTGTQPRSAAPREEEDDRSVVLVERVCESTIERQEVTLFANGTVRVRRRGPGTVDEPGGVEMELGELPPDELAAWTDRLREEDLSETEAQTTGPGGDWVERCELTLDYDAMARWIGPPPRPDRDHADWRPSGRAVYRYGHLDSLSLPLARVVALVDGFAARVDLASGRHSLPPGYRPRQGDVLRRADGILFRVERSTASKGGWELQGVDQPLVLYVLQDEIPTLFVELVHRR